MAPMYAHIGVEKVIVVISIDHARTHILRHDDFGPVIAVETKEKYQDAALPTLFFQNVGSYAIEAQTQITFGHTNTQRKNTIIDSTSIASSRSIFHTPTVRLPGRYPTGFT